MVYRAIGIMSGSSLDGLDIAFAEFHENAGKWNYELRATSCYSYSEEWMARLKNATKLTALDYLLLHADYGHYIGQKVNEFIEEHQLHYQASLIASHGHTVFHVPSKKMTSQLGDGAAIAAETGLPVVTDLRALDVALGGQGAPIVPIGEKMLMKGYDYFLNLGGIANISARPHPPNLLLQGEKEASQTPPSQKNLDQPGFTKAHLPETGVGGEVYIAFDICPANRVLNMLANEMGKEYDKGGEMAASGAINTALLEQLDQLDYYKQSYPKSLANDFGTDIVYPMIKSSGCNIANALRTYCEHIALQISNAIRPLKNQKPETRNQKLLATGGGAFNTFLMERLKENLKEQKIEVLIPDAGLVSYKEALIMAFIGVLRWRQEYNVLSSVTGSSRNSIGGALWTGQEA